VYNLSMSFEQLTDAQILAELARRVDYLRRSKQLTDQQAATRAGLSRMTLSAFRNEHKDITLRSFIKLLRGVGELGRLERLLPTAEATYSPAQQAVAEPPKRVRRRSDRRGDDAFKWGDET
jgi:transcriptional regulator with XRE-family HTH domain